MPKIDTLLRMMSEKRVDRVVLRGGSSYEVITAGEAVAGPVLAPEQLREIVSEILPSHHAADFNSGRSFQLQHSSPYGYFDIVVENNYGVLTATISPSITGGTGTNPVAASPSPQPYVAAPPAPAAYPPAPLHQNPGHPQTGAWPAQPPLPPHGGGYPNHPQPGYNPGPVQKSSKSKIAAGLFALLLPGLGIHHFYLGNVPLGVIQVLMFFVLGWFTCGITSAIVVIWSFVEGIIILCDGMKDSDGLPLS